MNSKSSFRGLLGKIAELPETCSHPSISTRSFEVLTHAPLVIALGFLAAQARWLYFGLLLAAIVFSVAHHIKPNLQLLMWAEWLFVIGVSVYLFVVYLNDFDTSDWILLACAIGFFFWSLYEFYWKQCRYYDFAHCIWHLIGGALLLKLVIQNPPDTSEPV